MPDNQDPQDIQDELQVQEPEPQDNPEPTEEEALANAKNPERTKEYIDRLKRERDEAYNRSVLDSLKPDPMVPTSPSTPSVPNAQNFSHLNQQQVEDVYQNLVDSQGYVDANMLKQALADANRRAQEAEQRAQRSEQRTEALYGHIREFEESEQMRRTHERFPHLDPNNKDAFDPVFYDLVKNQLQGQMVRGQVNVMSAAEEADKLYQRMKGNSQQDPQKAQAQKAKANISATTPQRSHTVAQRPVGEHQTDLSRRTMAGDRNALSERLKNWEKANLGRVLGQNEEE